MNKPLSIDLPHKLGTEEAKRRMQGGIGKLKDHIPGGGAEVAARWEGDRMFLDVRALGQEVTGHIDVYDSIVRLELMMPPLLAMIGSKLEPLIRKGGTELLEDRREP